MREFCIYCDKRLSAFESAQLTSDERRHSFILCNNCRIENAAEIDTVIGADYGEGIENYYQHYADPTTLDGQLK